MHALETLDIDVSKCEKVAWYIVKRLVTHSIPIEKLTLRGIQNYRLGKHFFETMKLPFLKDFGVDPLYFPDQQKYIKRINVLSLLSTHKQLTRVVLYVVDHSHVMINDEWLASVVHKYIVKQKILNEGDYDVTIKGASRDGDQNIPYTVPLRAIIISKC